MPEALARRWVALLLCVGLGCGGGGGMDRDGGGPPVDGGIPGSDAAGDATSDAATDAPSDAVSPPEDVGPLPFEIAPPEIPWLADGEPPVVPPVLTPCPAGWAERELAGVPICEPWPAGQAEECSPGEAHLLGSAGCAPLGGACPGGDFADNPPLDRSLVYVQSGAPGGGDGTEALPYASLAEALAAGALVDDVWIALGRGSYETVMLPTGATLEGVCPAETLLVPPPGLPADSAAVVVGSARTLELRDLRIEPGPHAGIRVEGGMTTLRLHAVEIARATCDGIDVVQGAHLDAELVVVRDTRPCTAVPSIPSVGLLVREGGTVADVRQSLFLRAAEAYGVSVVVASGGSLRLHDTIVRLQPPTVGDLFERLGFGLLAIAGASVELRRVLFEDNPRGHVRAMLDGTVVDAEASLFRTAGSVLTADIRDPKNGGLYISHGATLDARRVAVTGAETHPLEGAIRIEGGAVLLTDAVVADNRIRGLLAQTLTGHPLRLDVRRTVLQANRTNDIVVEGGSTAEASVLLEDVRLGRTQPGAPVTFLGELVPTPALAVSARGQSDPMTVSLERVVVENAVDEGIRVEDRLTVVTAEDVVVRGTTARDDLGGGFHGVDLASLSLARALFEGNASSAIALESFPGPTTLSLEDAVLRETRAETEGTFPGAALVLGGGIAATLRRVEVESSDGGGVWAFEGTSAHLEDLRVRETDLRPCAVAETCEPYGHAIGAYGATLDAARFAIERAVGCGVQLARGAEMDLADGLIAYAGVGACIEVDGYDASRLTEGVIYHHNTEAAGQRPVPRLNF